MTAPTRDNSPPAIKLPADLQAQGFVLRRENDDDIPFLARLYASTREAELAPLPWTPEQKQQFLLHQFNAQRHHYYAYFTECAFAILECRAEPVGRLYLKRRDARLHVVDISLMPEWRGKGLGAQIMAAVIATAGNDGLGVSICVEKFNPALRLYRRLGFEETGDNGVYLEMAREAA